ATAARPWRPRPCCRPGCRWRTARSPRTDRPAAGGEIGRAAQEPHTEPLGERGGRDDKRDDCKRGESQARVTHVASRRAAALGSLGFIYTGGHAATPAW